jgi:hypothetical protein
MKGTRIVIKVISVLDIDTGIFWLDKDDFRYHAKLVMEHETIDTSVSFPPIETHCHRYTSVPMYLTQESCTVMHEAKFQENVLKTPTSSDLLVPNSRFVVGAVSS